MDPVNVPAKFEVRGFTQSWDNRGYPKNWAVPGYAHTNFSPEFLMGFVRMDPMNVQPNLNSVASPVPEIIAIRVGGGCEPQSWGRRGRRGQGWFRL